MRDFFFFFFSKGAFCALRGEKKDSKERMGKGKRKEEKSGRGKKKKKEEKKKGKGGPRKAHARGDKTHIGDERGNRTEQKGALSFVRADETAPAFRSRFPLPRRFLLSSFSFIFLKFQALFSCFWV